MKLFKNVLIKVQEFSNKKFGKYCLIIIISLISSIILYLFLYNRYPIYFTHVNWIYDKGGDTFQHQLGWEFFRNEPWHFPIGIISSVNYPFGSNLTFMDSIPLLAIPFKLISPILETRFQYFGLWEFISIFMQFFIGICIFNEFTDSWDVKILGGFFLILSPPMIWRAFIHSSLTAHWLILFSIWLLIRTYRDEFVPRWIWPVVFSLSILIHLYFFAMLLPLWAVSQLFRYQKSKLIKPIFLDSLILVVSSAVVAWILGVFNSGNTNLGKWGFGYYSWNLNGFINPMSTSSIIESISTGTKGQYEGYSYLGLGIILLLIFSFYILSRKNSSLADRKFIIPISIVSAFYILFALSNSIYLNDKLIWGYQISNQWMLKLLSIFRSSGRFIWPVFYLVFLFPIIVIINNTKKPTYLLLIALFIQTIDIQSLYTSRGISQFVEYHSPLVSEFWQEASKSNNNIILYPIDNSAFDYYEPISEYAQINQMKINWVYTARNDQDILEEFVESKLIELKNGNVNPETLYIFYNDVGYKALNEVPTDSAVICDIDGYRIALSNQNPILTDNSAWLSTCTEVDSDS